MNWLRTSSSRVWFKVTASLLIGLVVGVFVSEGSHLLLKDETDRPPARIELVIPAGTAEKIKNNQPVDLPANMVFVEGDVLAVRNEDSVSHQLGPIWVPPGTTGTLKLDQAQRHSYTCTFQPSSSLGLDVRTRTTLEVRLIGILSIGLPTGLLLAVYSLVLSPGKPPKQSPAG
ncbi:MAG TPA: hypothetical protein VIO61_15620 [Anaerolineaceae bacterium]